MANNIDITTWLDFSLQQIAAESYLEGVSLNVNSDVIPLLIDGNNHREFISADERDNFSGQTRLTPLLADRLLEKFELSHQVFPTHNVHDLPQLMEFVAVQKADLG